MSEPPLFRSDFRALALERRQDAELLLTNGRFGGAYYLSGYVVECALKACIAKGVRRYQFPPRATTGLYTHDLSLLVKSAGLGPELDALQASDSAFETYWGIVKDWRESSRYYPRSRQEAVDIFEAVTDRRHGGLRWLRRHW